MPAISIDLALLAGRALFLVFCFVLAAVTFVRWRRAADRGTTQLSQQTALVLEQLTSLEGRIDALQSQLSGTAQCLEELKRSSTAATSSPSYEIAIRMARGGSDREELMRSCGLTRQEAELVQRLHAPPATRQPGIALAAAAAA